MVIKYRIISRWVTVTGPPLRICSRNKGTTEPEDSSTFPKRTMQKRVPFALLL